MLILRWLLLAALFSQIVPTVAHAGCCRIVKVDTTTSAAVVRVCAPDANEGCAAVLFEGTLALGASRNVCTDEPTIVYQEQDASTGVFGGLVGAVCDDGEVEI